MFRQLMYGGFDGQYNLSVGCFFIVATAGGVKG